MEMSWDVKGERKTRVPFEEKKEKITLGYISGPHHFDGRPSSVEDSSLPNTSVPKSQAKAEPTY